MKNKLVYFISRSSMFGIGFFLLFKNTGKDAWISLLLGTLLSLFIMYIYKIIKENLVNNSIKDTLNKSIIGKFYIIIFLLFYTYLIIMILTILPMFVNSFYLLYTPKILIIIPFTILSVYLSNKDKTTLAWLSTLLFTFSIIIIFTYAFLLIKYIDVNNFYPIYTTKNINILKSAFIYASITSIPQIISFKFYTSFKEDVKNYLLCSLTNLIMVLFIIMSLGEPLLTLYSFPEYAVLKQIKILDFIENIENLSSFIWYFDLFITFSTLTSNVKDIMPKKYNKVYYFIFIIFTIIIANFIIGYNYIIIINLFYSYAYILFIFFLLFITLAIYLKKKNTLKSL